MEGGDQTTISPEFLENIQSAVNSQGVLGQVQVIETENGPVTVLFMEEGADTSNIGGDNITLSVGETDQNISETVIEDPNTGVQYQYHVQAEDYTQLLQGAVGDTVVSVTEPVKEDLAVEPVIDLPAADQTTAETFQQPIGDTSTDTYYITDTGEILKIDSSLLGENAGDATLQLQTQDGTLQILNQVGTVQTSQVETAVTYSQPTEGNINITYDQGNPFEYTATKVDSPLVIDTARVEEPKVLSYKTTNRQRTNIMRQPLAKSTPATIQPKPTVSSQTVQTSLIAPSQYKTVKQRETSGTTTTEVVYPQSYQKQTIVFPKVQKQTQNSNVIKTGQQSYQSKVKSVPQQMITTVMKPQSLLKTSFNQTVTSSPVVSKLGASQIPATKVTTANTYGQKQVPAVSKFQPQVLGTQVSASTKQQTDLLSVAMKQAEVPQQVLSLAGSMTKTVATPEVLKDTKIDLPGSGKLTEKGIDEQVSQELAIGEKTHFSVPPTEEIQATEKQQPLEQQVTQTTVSEKVDPLENPVVSLNEELFGNKMDTDEQQTEAVHPVLDEKTDDVQTANKMKTSIPDTSVKQVAINRLSQNCCEENKLSCNEIEGENGVKKFKGVNCDENTDLVEENGSIPKANMLVTRENDANKFGTIHCNSKEIKQEQKSSQFVDKTKKDSNIQVEKGNTDVKSSVNKNVTEKIAFTGKVHNIPIKRILKCDKCPFTTSKKTKLQRHMFEQHKVDSSSDISKSQHDLSKKDKIGFSPNKSKSKELLGRYKISREAVPLSVYNKHTVEIHTPKMFKCETCKEVFWSDESLHKHQESVCKSSEINKEKEVNIQERRTEKPQLLHVKKHKKEFCTRVEDEYNKNTSKIFLERYKNSEQENVEMLNEYDVDDDDDDDDDNDDDSVRIIDIGNESDDNVIEISECETESDNESEQSNTLKSVSLDKYNIPELTEWPRVVLGKTDDKKLTSGKLLENHSGKKGERSCIFCKKLFVGSNSLNKHLRAVHTGPFICQKCKFSCRKKVEYREHLQSHKMNNYKCIQCFPIQKQQSSKHLQKQYLCELCGRKMITKKQCLIHMDLHQGIYPFRCPQCNFGFLKKSILEKHTKKCGTVAETRYLTKVNNFRDKANIFERKKVIGYQRCKLCKKSFLSLRGLTVHNRMFHGVIPKKKVPKGIAGYEKLTVSELCKKEKASLSFKKNKFWSVNFPAEEINDAAKIRGVKNEIMDEDDGAEIHVNVEELQKVYRCSFCKQCFHDLVALILHVDVHKTVCSICGRRFQNYFALRQHRLCHHTDTDENSFDCAKCNQQFRNRNDLLHHMKRYFGPWICEKKGCGVKFYDKRELHKHRLTHTSGKFECVCKQRFKNRFELSKHSKTKNYKCRPLEWPDGGIICMNENIYDKVYLNVDIPVNSVDNFIQKGKDIVVEGKGTIRGPYICKECKAQFVSYSLTKRHILLRHCKKIKQKNYRCSLCSFLTHSFDVFKTHHKSHMDSFKCDFCPFSFDEEDSFEKHIQYHLKDKYQCFYCSKKYICRSVCREHVLTYHGRRKKKPIHPMAAEESDEASVEEMQNGRSSLIHVEGKHVDAQVENYGSEKFNETDVIRLSQKCISIIENSCAVSGILAAGYSGSGENSVIVDNDNECIEEMCEDNDELTTYINQKAKSKPDKTVLLERQTSTFEGKQTSSAKLPVEMTKEVESLKEGGIATPKNILSFNSPKDFEEGLADGDNVDHDNELLLSDATLQPSGKAKYNPSVEFHPASPETTNDNMVDQLRTNVTEEVWNTAVREEDPSYSLTMDGMKDIPKAFNEYKGIIPEGLEFYVPNVQPYKCGGCSILCDGELNFKKHTITLHTERSKCKICNKRSMSHTILVAHMIDKHLVGLPLSCPVCQMEFKKTKTYWRHAEMHAKCFECEVCHQKFRRKMDLAEHAKTHVEGKEFCVKCGEVFDTHDYLRVHCWRVHQVKMNKRRTFSPFGSKMKSKGKKLQTAVWQPKKVCKSEI